MIQRRIAMSAGLLVMAFALIAFRLVDVMVLKGRVTGATADFADRPPAMRADLFDRNGQLLARDSIASSRASTIMSWWRAGSRRTRRIG